MQLFHPSCPEAALPFPAGLHHQNGFAVGVYPQLLPEVIAYFLLVSKPALTLSGFWVITGIVIPDAVPGSARSGILRKVYEFHSTHLFLLPMIPKTTGVFNGFPRLRCEPGHDSRRFDRFRREWCRPRYRRPFAQGKPGRSGQRRCKPSPE